MIIITQYILVHPLAEAFDAKSVGKNKWAHFWTVYKKLLFIQSKTNKIYPWQIGELPGLVDQNWNKGWTNDSKEFTIQSLLQENTHLGSWILETLAEQKRLTMFNQPVSMFHNAHFTTQHDDNSSWSKNIQQGHIYEFSTTCLQT